MKTPTDLPEMSLPAANKTKRGRPPAMFLRRVLLADAATCGAMGLLLMLGAGRLEPLLGLPAELSTYAGLSLLPFAAFLVALAKRRDLALPAVRAVIVLNALWTVTSVLLLVSGAIALTPLGQAFVILQAMCVAVFVGLEYFGFRKLAAAAGSRNFVAALLAVVSSTTLPAAGFAQPVFKSDRITLEIQGEGPDVILIPGLTSSPDAWRDAAAALPAYRYHFVQVKGFAGTAPEGNEKGALVATTAEEIVRYITERKLENPAVIGHSVGGTVALMIGTRHPRAISQLMVVDQLPFLGLMYGPQGATAESVKPVADALRAQMRAQTAEARRQQIEEMTAALVANVARRPAVVQSALESDQAVTADAFHEMIVTDLRPELAKIAVPATVLYVTPPGSRLSDAQIDDVFRESYANLENVKLVRIPESAHFIMYDNPARFGLEMKTFLK